ncbi:hypothetical protein [Bosea sp. (in: a-proteobacteria)]|uniref:hypothetical protein n=1 Tax=Bosea sp. (in: a-proteobacteria) TaxID=1871050 RepID=UPI002618FC78|nr:hypothetical protein [Bosea sp. (in: a-proteobacteria)]MCO5090332.1 hypothetical protein [Bosea sp. (in: a-proteobacteria)]
MPKSSLAPALRAIVFFGLMGAAVSCLTLGAGLQMPTDTSSTSVALARGEPTVAPQPVGESPPGRKHAG